MNLFSWLASWKANKLASEQANKLADRTSWKAGKLSGWTAFRLSGWQAALSFPSSVPARRRIALGGGAVALLLRRVDEF